VFHQLGEPTKTGARASGCRGWAQSTAPTRLIGIGVASFCLSASSHAGVEHGIMILANDWTILQLSKRNVQGYGMMLIESRLSRHRSVNDRGWQVYR
jgi:hypothetical protein